MASAVKCPKQSGIVEKLDKEGIPHENSTKDDHNDDLVG